MTLCAAQGTRAVLPEGFVGGGGGVPAHGRQGVRDCFAWASMVRCSVRLKLWPCLLSMAFIAYCPGALSIRGLQCATVYPTASTWGPAELFLLRALELRHTYR